MPFEKGQSGNPSGKPKGAIGKKRQMWEELGEYIVTEGAEKYMDYIKSLPGEEFSKRYEAILNYFQPKRQSSTMDLTSGGEPIQQITGMEVK